MFAGPYGSGKSELKKYLPKSLLGVYLNPDDLERLARQQRFLDLNAFGVAGTEAEVLPFFRESALLASLSLGDQARQLEFAGGRLEFRNAEINSYFASVLVEFLRQRLMAANATFTLETVMSHPGKAALLKEAQLAEYRTYLNYIATDDPAINVSRVRARVRQGGHDVPEDRIENRYHRSLDLLIEAIRFSSRAFIFDNSGENQSHSWLAEITDGKELEMKTSQVPAWFKRSVLDKFAPSVETH